MRLAVACSTLVFALAAAAQSPGPEENEIPELAPPLPELPPTFWAQHGPTIVVATVLCLAVVILLVWRKLHPRPVVPAKLADRARQALAELRSRPEDSAVLSQVSQILRRYFCEAYALSSGELTTAEFCRALEHCREVEKDLSAPVSDFLRRADELKFSTAKAGCLDGAEKALEFIARAEAQLEVLRRAQQPDSNQGLRA